MQSGFALCTAVYPINAILFLVLLIKTGGRMNGIRSVAFSPAETTQVAVSGFDGAKIIDIRQPHQ